MAATAIAITPIAITAIAITAIAITATAIAIMATATTATAIAAITITATAIAAIAITAVAIISFIYSDKTDRVHTRNSWYQLVRDQIELKFRSVVFFLEGGKNPGNPDFIVSSKSRVGLINNHVFLIDYN